MTVVTDHLRGKHVAFEEVAHRQAFTAVDEARALGMPADAVIKTVVLRSGSRDVIVVVPGSRRLDMKKVRGALEDQRARLATEEEVRADLPQFELGAVPPLGSLASARVYVDPEVMDHPTILFAAGDQTHSIKVRSEDLFRGEPVTVVPLARHPDGDERTE